jgi:hypothetical protein
VIIERIITTIASASSGSAIYGGVKKQEDNNCFVIQVMSDRPLLNHGSTWSQKAHILITAYSTTNEKTWTMSKWLINLLMFNNGYGLLTHEDSLEVETNQKGLYRVDNKFWVWYEE